MLLTFGLLFSGQIGLAQFNGVVSMPSDGVINVGPIGPLPTEGSISFWMKPQAFDSYRNMLTTASLDGNNRGIRFELHTDGTFDAIFGPADNNSLQGITSPPLTLNAWYHVVLTWNQTTTTGKLYINGVLTMAKTDLTAFYSDFTHVSIGAGFNNSRTFRGSLDEVAFWNKELSASDITSIQSAELTGQESGLLAYYTMNQNGQGPGLTVTNHATATAGLYNGITVGDVVFSSPCTSLSVTLTPTNVTACTGQSVTLSAIPTDDVTYLWNTGETSSSISTTTSGVYSLTVSNTIGCQATASTTVAVLPLLSLTISAVGSQTNLCPEQPLTLTATGCEGGAFYWSTGFVGESLIATPMATTVVWATCTKNGCSGPASNTVTLSVRSAPVVTTNAATTLCSGTGISLSVTNCTGGRVRWSSGQTTVSITVSPTVTTAYSATCTVGSCSIASTNALTVTVKPVVTVPTIFASMTQVCAGFTTTLSASGCGGGTIRWSTGQTTEPLRPTINNTTAFWATCTQDGCVSGRSNSLTITAIPLPASPTVTAATQTVCAGTTISLTASGCEGGTIRWSTLETGRSILITSVVTTNYWATCTKNGCISPQSVPVRITVSPIPVITISATSTISCAGTPITLRAGGCSGTVRWSSGATGTSLPISPIITTAYSATCTQNGCVGISNSLIIRVKPIPVAPVVALSSATICAGQFVTLTASGCVGGIIRWSNNRTGNSLQLNPTTSTTLLATCTQEACTSPSSNSVAIAVTTLPTSPTLVASHTAICTGSSVTLSASGCDGGYVNWSNGLIGVHIVSSLTATTVFTARCVRNNCSSGASAGLRITVFPRPTVVISPASSSVCVGTSVTLRASGCSGTIYWSDGSIGTDRRISPSVTTAYSATCTQNGCVAVSNGATVTVKPMPMAPAVGATATTICAGQTVSLTATGCVGGTIWWSNGRTGTSQTLSLTANSVFWATCTQDGCTGINSNSVTVTVKPTPAAPVISPAAVTVCVGTPVSLTATGCSGGIIIWNAGETGSVLSITPVSTGVTGTLCLQDGCISTKSATVRITVNAIPSPPSISPANPPAVCLGQSLTLTATGCSGGTVRWGDGTTGSRLVYRSVSLLPTIIRARCERNGCQSSSDLVIVSSRLCMSARTANISVTEPESPLIVAPVPFVTDITVWLPASNAAADIRLVDLNGQVRRNLKAIAGDATVRLEAADLPAGVYLIQVIQNQRRYVKKVLKQ